VRLLIQYLPEIADVYRKLRIIQQKYPDCLAGKAIASALKEGDEEWVLNTENAISELKDFLVAKA